MKSYVINLDRSPERLALFEEQAKQVDLTYERFTAIDGKDLSELIINSARAKRFQFAPINRYETALFLSHRALWTMQVKQSLPFIAIFEDDVLLSSHINELFTLIELKDAVSDIIKVETTGVRVVLGDQIATTSRFALRELHSWHGGTAAYVISLAGAKKLLACFTKVADPVDLAIFHPIAKANRKLHISQCVPALSIQRDHYFSDANDKLGTTLASPARTGHFRHGPFIDGKRAIYRFIESLRKRWLNKIKGYDLEKVEFNGPND